MDSLLSCPTHTRGREKKGAFHLNTRSKIGKRRGEVGLGMKQLVVGQMSSAAVCVAMLISHMLLDGATPKIYLREKRK